MKHYAAITIGPIIDTLSIAASPGTLWCASTMFSRLAGDLCESILDQIPGAKILAPAYDKGFVNKEGIGRFHDRIFFVCEMEREDLAKTLPNLCAQAKSELAWHIFEALGRKGESDAINSYIQRYIQLSWLIAGQEEAEKFDEAEQGKADQGAAEKKKNCILNLSQYLDCMELNTQAGPDETDSPIFRLLSGTEESNNTYIYRKEKGSPVACWLIPENPESGVFQLLKKGRVRDIEDIADPFDTKDGRKLRHYFAVVQSDGDNMGKFLEACPPDGVREFSAVCIDYTVKAAGLVGDYGGLTIYAGGDDLLFLAPLEGKNQESLLSLCENISSLFNQRFQALAKKLNASQTPSLSFGISINYRRSPLYEALEDARNLLFGQAKTGEKNQIALSMHKHSGQSVFLLLPNDSAEGAPLNKLVEMINASCGTKKEKAEDALNSVLYQLETFRTSFLESRRQGFDLQNLYDNLFDAAAHDMGRDYIDRVKALGDAVSQSSFCRADDGNNNITSESLDVLTSMLRFVKLYTERGNEA